MAGNYNLRDLQMGMREMTYHDVVIVDKLHIVRLSIDMKRLAREIAIRADANPSKAARTAFGAIRAQLVLADGRHAAPGPQTRPLQGAVKQSVAAAKAKRAARIAPLPPLKVRVVWPDNALSANRVK